MSGKKAKSPPQILEEELARNTEEHAALAAELVELARQLCETASELNKILRLAYVSPPTRD